jgi:HTH-type transcriptional regulator/antitoxin HigA
MALFPIRNEQDYDRAMARIDELFGARLGTPEGYEFDAFVTLVDAYESKHFPVGINTPEQTIVVYMEDAGLTRKDLEPMIGTRARVSEVLSGKRRLTLDMIRRLHEGLGIPLEDLISPNIEGLQPAVRRASARSRKPAATAKPAPRTRRQPVRQAAG